MRQLGCWKIVAILLVCDNSDRADGFAPLSGATSRPSSPSMISNRYRLPAGELRRRIQRRQTYPRSFTLSSLSDNANDGRRNNNPVRRLGNLVTRVVRRMVSARARTVAQFQRLSTKAKRIVLVQMVLLCLIFGSIAKTAVKNVTAASATAAPMEIAYSTFLDLMELPQAKSNLKVDYVRVGTDRISYRIYREAGSEESYWPLQMLTSSKRPPADAPTMSNIDKSNGKFVNAYTRTMPSSSLSPELVQTLRDNNVLFTAAATPKGSTAALVLRTFMVTFYFLILWRLYRTVSGNAADPGAPGKLAGSSTANSLVPNTSFDDIQGIDGAKHEVMELVDALRHPEKYAVLGARSPTGLLLEGLPGTGKTMLARATAATAGVPLLYCSGSDFVEMYVGRGAARVRKLFERAQKLAPCIIFIDELDALGKSRDAGGGLSSFTRSNDEAEQTLNQLLACMDGLDSTRRVCVLAATNRKQVLDPALIRPGRFDRIVQLSLPDALGRERILRVHARKLPGFVEGSGVDPTRPNALGRDHAVDLSAVAAVTDGLCGAELEFIVNEAAIRAVRRVSAALRNATTTAASTSAATLTPHVSAQDFEASVYSFYETRRPNKLGMGNIFKDIAGWK